MSSDESLEKEENGNRSQSITTSASTATTAKSKSSMYAGDEETAGAVVKEGPLPTTNEDSFDEDAAGAATQHPKGGLCSGFMAPIPPYPGDDDFDENDAPVHYVVNEWAQGTSIHGVPFVTDTIAWKFWKRVVWVVLVLISSGFMIWQIATLIQQYLDYEVNTDTQTIDPESLKFPEITFCNTNMFSKSRMEKYGITDPANSHERLLLLTPLEELIVGTFFNGRELETSKVWTRRHTTEGNCFSFDTNELVTSPGYYGGLQIWADLRQWDYEPMTQYAGGIVMAEQPGSYIDGQLTNYPIKAGRESFVNLRMVQFDRERQAPWARCFGEAPEYTQAKCRAFCAFAEIRESCGCRVFSDTDADPSMRYCRSRNSTTTDNYCILPLLDKNVTGDCHACALPSCSQTSYQGYTNDLDFADNWLQTFDFERFNTTKNYMLHNFVSVTVNFDRIQYTRLTESKAVSFAQLLGSIGGSMGFFLGISLLSVFELVGDLGLMRLVPRWCGHRHLYGLGARKSE